MHMSKVLRHVTTTHHPLWIMIIFARSASASYFCSRRKWFHPCHKTEVTEWVSERFLRLMARTIFMPVIDICTDSTAWEGHRREDESQLTEGPLRNKGASMCPRLDAREPDPLARSARVAQRGRFRARNSGDTRGKPRGKKRGGGLEEKELQLSSQTRTICLICVTCFLLIWEVCWRDLGVWERPGRAGPWAKASLLLGSMSKGHYYPANLHC